MSFVDFSARQGIHSLLAKTLIAAVALTVLAYGSVAEAPLNLAVIVFALLAGVSLALPIGALSIARIHAATIVLLAALVIYVVAQTLPFAAGDFANGAWKSVNDLVSPVQGTISVAPGMTLDAIPALALPFLVFLSALALFHGDAQALLLWRALAYFGAGYAIFGIVQDLFFPQQLLFEQKRFYLGSLTASFVNRNTAGTFFGVAFLLNFGLVFFYLQKIHIYSLTRKLLILDICWGDKYSLLLIHALCCLIIAVALFLTQSRGAVGASFVGAVLSVMLMAKRRLTADSPGEKPTKFRRYAGFLGGVAVIVGMFALFAGRSINRMEAQGLEDGRWCSFSSTIAAIRDHPIFGTGFGAFQDVFPAYRSADCGDIFGVWDRAHNFFLEGYLGLGAPFAMAVIAGYAVLGGALVRGLHNRHTLRCIPVMGLGALILVTLHSTVDFSLQIPGFASYFAALMAASVTISLGRSRQ